MQLTVTNLHSDTKRSFVGPEEELCKDLIYSYPFLAEKGGWKMSLFELIKILNKCQAYVAEVDNSSDMFKSEVASDEHLDRLLGFDKEDNLWLEAAAFLGGVEIDDDLKRIFRAYVNDEEETDPKKAALQCCGLDPSNDNIKALESVMDVVSKSHKLSKSEDLEGSKKFKECKPFNDAAKPFADIVQKAIDNDTIRPIVLGGKHSSGAMLVADMDKQEFYLCKPGFGKNNPSAGVRENPASQSAREAAYWAVATAVGLRQYYPECHLVSIDGQEMAVMKFLAHTFRTMKEIKRKDPGSIRRALYQHLIDGSVHKWAALAWILGDPDVHAGNVMMRNDEIKLIDHGSAFATDAFSPASDKYAFIPFYLRSFAPSNFKKMAPEEKLKWMPRVDAMTAAQIGQWLRSINPGLMAEIIQSYGIDAGPSVRRLETLQTTSKTMPADLAINAAWVLP